jgi:hypothetical protein
MTRLAKDTFTHATCGKCSRPIATRSIFSACEDFPFSILFEDLVANRFIFLTRFAFFFEWGTLWLLAADSEGRLTKETIRSQYDGSLFYKIEEAEKAKKVRAGGKGFKPMKRVFETPMKEQVENGKFE